MKTNDTGSQERLASAMQSAERETVLLGVIALVRNHPDFDNGGPMADAMDQAMRGETPKILGDIARLRHGVKPPATEAKSHQELLAVAEKVLHSIDNNFLDVCFVWEEELRAAIRKAKGETNVG